MFFPLVTKSNQCIEILTDADFSVW